MAFQFPTAITRQEERDHRLAILIQQQEKLVARQLGINSGIRRSHTDQDFDETIVKSLLGSSDQAQAGDLETDGLTSGQRSSPDPLLTLPSTGANSIPQVKGQTYVPSMSSRRARRFDPVESASENHVAGSADEHSVWRQPDLLEGAASHMSDPDTSDERDEEDNFEEIRNMPSNFNENERIVSNEDEQNPEIQGASNQFERRRSLENNDEDEICKEIEELMKMGALSKSEADSMQERQRQKFRLNNMTKWQRNNENEELRPFVFDTDGIPVNWTDDGESTNHSSGHSMDVRLVNLLPGQMEYDKIEEEFKETGIKITKIERIQNMYLLDRFKSEMEDTARRRHPGFDLNIQYLYHGTKADKTRICEEGLDQRLSRMGYFGKGIYFSDNPLKCVYYTENMDDSGDAYILKCRVILGDSKCFPEGQYDTGLKREPEKENVKPGMWRFYDSVAGCPRDYNEFVVYENRRAMIEYIITFKISPQVVAALQQSNTMSAATASQSGGEGEPFDENHLDRIRQVRETVRKKRCQDRGIAYIEPNHQRKQQDDHIWNKLQKIHVVKETEVKTEKVIPEESATRTRNEPSDMNIYKTDDFEIHEPVTWEDEPSHRRATSRGGNFHQEPDPVDQVMSGLLQEFLGVTSTEDVEMAKYYITTNQMNVNDAILNYYNDLP